MTGRPALALALQLPDAVERWRGLYLAGASEKLILFLALGLLFYAAARLVRRVLGDNIEDVNRRHALRKWVGYAYAALLLLTGIALFADWLEGLGAFLALTVAAIAVALQDVIRSVVGWLYISSRSGIDVGSRVEVGGVVGDVIDVGVLKTTLLEVGGDLVYGRQSTGRLVSVPNSRLLFESVLVSAASSPFVWQEVRVVVTFESDWKRAEETLRSIGDEIHAEIAPELAQGFQSLERRYAFKYGTLTPIVYVTIAESGVELVLRFLIHVRRRRSAVDRVSRRILTAFRGDPEVQIAYPTRRLYRRGEPPSTPLDPAGEPEAWPADPPQDP